MIPVARSAYTYPYSARGETFAWVISWDRILENTGGNMWPAVSRFGCPIKLLAS